VFLLEFFILGCHFVVFVCVAGVVNVSAEINK